MRACVRACVCEPLPSLPTPPTHPPTLAESIEFADTLLLADCAALPTAGETGAAPVAAYDERALTRLLRALNPRACLLTARGGSDTGASVRAWW
jgi:hypothetical protein